MAAGSINGRIDERVQNSSNNSLSKRGRWRSNRGRIASVVLVRSEASSEEEEEGIGRTLVALGVGGGGILVHSAALGSIENSENYQP